MSEGDVGRIFEKLEAHGLSLARIEERLSALPCRKHAKFIDGNGKDSAEIRLDRVERTTGVFRKIVLWIVSGLSVALGGALWALIQRGIQ